MKFLNLLDALRGGHQEDAADASATVFLEHVDRGDQGATGGQHGVEDKRNALLDLAGHLDVVFDRFQGLLVAVKTHHADLGRRDQVEHPVHHPQTGPQDRHHRDFFTLDALDDHVAGPPPDGSFFGFQILGGLERQQAGKLGSNIPEILDGDIVFTHQSQFVLDQRVLHDAYGHGVLLCWGLGPSKMMNARSVP